MEPHETKKLLYSKEYHHHSEEEEWKKVFTRFKSDRELQSRIYKAQKLNTKKTIPIKMGHGTKQRVLRKRNTNDQEMYSLKCSISLTTRKMQSKTTLDFTIKQPEWPMSKIQITTHAGEEFGKEEHFSIESGSANCCTLQLQTIGINVTLPQNDRNKYTTFPQDVGDV